ncbi:MULTISPECIES: LysR substrate-binding domain-containing protein [unclassified Paraburkholderia]|uniref:LysR substrate-binding domain-containing protein n=1 Tax=unclassified Paraburkholderia TaxID=2615204 RepID=UPI00161AAA9D|nr:MULTISPECIES: LysR substrate-binding domain-containing protein [unclassified Paraburkholderia]MBB5406166.1 DNA-binding transcriptional LysR family regulator [Paraburkholderia sp. HC6.4b]MBB5448562.1 DNA-binding transcriptional LysR family regulator [Paraburkholderia sp. Kb1A]
MSQQREAIDTYLLRVLHTLLMERSVTRAAVKLNQSQPAISAALRRLRDITGDPLLVRGKSGMVPTEYGLRLLEPVQNALREIERIKFQQHNFDPATSIRCYRIGCPDYLNVLFVPTVVERFRKAAPNATLEFHSLGPAFDYELALEDGKLDIVVGNWPEPPEQLHLSNLFVDQIVCLMSNTHPFAKRGGLTLDQYLNAPHLAPTPYSVGQRGAIDVHLARERLKRHVVVTLPYFNLAPYVLIKSDLIFTTTRLFADYYANFLPLTVMPAPLDFPPMQYYQLWHERVHYSDEVRWLRGVVGEATRTLIDKS